MGQSPVRSTPVSAELGRRTVVRGIVATGALAFVPRGRWLAAAVETASGGPGGRFLNAHEMATLRALADRLIPGPPEDPDPGASIARCAEAIDALLAAFSFDPPLIHAGGPFSNRAGAERDDMARFVPLDPVSELGWRIRLEGTKGRPDRMFGGPVNGLQEMYQQGLAALDRRSRPEQFASATRTVQLRVMSDANAADFVSAVMADCIGAMYGPPEYHGNHDRSGWKPIDWPGDVQPHGWSDHQVSSPDRTSSRPMQAAEGRAALLHFIPGMEDVR